MPLDPAFVDDCPYAPDALFIDEVVEVDPERSRVVCRMPVHAELPLTRSQRVHPTRHPRHVNGGLMVHMTGVLGLVHAYYILGLRHTEGWIGYGARIHEARFAELARVGQPLSLRGWGSRVRRSSDQVVVRYGFEFRQGETLNELHDLADCVAMWSDPVVTRFIGGKPSTPAEVWHRLLRYVGHWQLLGFGYWVVREKVSDAFVGEVGFADWKRDLETPFGNSPELGYALSPSHHGRGFATEAVGAATSWADANLRGARTWCLISPEAKTSIRVAEKCGYREVERMAYHDQPIVLFARG